MAEGKMFFDREGKTLTLWFTDRSREYIKLNFSIPLSDSLRVALETVPA